MNKKDGVEYTELVFDVANGSGEDKWELKNVTVWAPETINDFIRHLGPEIAYNAILEHHKIRSQDRARQIHKGSKNKAGEWVRRPGSDDQAREAAQAYEFGAKTRIQAAPRLMTPNEFAKLPRNEREAYLASLIAADETLTKGE